MSSPVPPGITQEGTLTERHSGGSADSESWLAYDKIKLYTNAFIKEEGRVVSVSDRAFRR